MTNLPMTRLALAAATIHFAVAVRAQHVAEGFATVTQPLSATTSLVLTTPGGIVAFDGTNVTLTPPSQPPVTLLQLPAFTFGSFLLQMDAAHVLFGCTGSQDAVWLLPLQGPAPAQPLALVPFNYDAAVLTPTTVLVSARLGGFSAPSNDLLVLDVTNGGVLPVASLPGASGPVTTAANGDVYYATGSLAFPTPPGLTQILRIRRPVLDAAIITAIVLGPAQTETVFTGLDSAGDLAIDDDGDLLFVDWMNASVAELSDADGPAPWLATPIADYAIVATLPTALQFIAGTGAGTGAGVFEPFQPANGTLMVHETDFFSTAQLRRVRGAPASLAATGPSPHAIGPFDLVTTNGPAFGIGILAFDSSSAPGTIPLSVPGFEQPLQWSASLVGAPALVPVSFDALGSAVLTVVNPGFAPPLSATVQVLHVSATGVLGATAPLPMSIAQ